MTNFHFTAQNFQTGELYTGTVKAKSMQNAMKAIRRGNRYQVVKSCIAL